MVALLVRARFALRRTERIATAISLSLAREHNSHSIATHLRALSRPASRRANVSWHRRRRRRRHRRADDDDDKPPPPLVYSRTSIHSLARSYGERDGCAVGTSESELPAPSPSGMCVRVHVMSCVCVCVCAEPETHRREKNPHRGAPVVYAADESIVASSRHTRRALRRDTARV